MIIGTVRKNAKLKKGESEQETKKKSKIKEKRCGFNAPKDK